ITGANSADTGGPSVFDGFVAVGSNLNGSDGNTIALIDAGLNAGTASLGPLTSTGGAIGVGDPSSPTASPGIMTVDGTVTLDSASEMGFNVDQAGTTAGTDYGQLSATGNV